VTTKRITILILAILMSSFSSINCSAQKTTSSDTYTAGKNYILKNGTPLIIKGVVYVPIYPGFLPWELSPRTDLPEKLKKSIVKDIRDIKEMGANTIRFWDVPAFCYKALKDVGGLCFIQTVWFDASQNDYQSSAYKEKCKKNIVIAIDRIYSVYSQDDPPPIVAFLVGNELYRRNVLKTDTLHPEIKSYKGAYVSAQEGATPTECFLAEMADYTKEYEMVHYGQSHLVSYSNEVRTEDILDTPFLDFRSYNIYPYGIWEESRIDLDKRNKSLFEMWTEHFKKEYPDKPLLITETGLSESPNAQHTGPPHYGYGGNTEDEHAEYLQETWKELIAAKVPLAGMCIHEYLDSWWKFGKEDSLEHDPSDVEEWFGIVAIEPEGDWYKTVFRKVYNTMKKQWAQ